MTDKIKLFIIEDYFLTRITYNKYFENSSNIEVSGEFSNAEDAIEALKTTECDIALIDLGLPKMNGIEATRFINEHYPKLKCIILTSHETENEVMACVACGARAYILKETPLQKIDSIIQAVNIGAYWFDEKLEHIPINTVPSPNSTDFNNLYVNSDMERKKLTDREYEVLKLMCLGKTNPEIAEELYISINTAKAHVGRVITKLGVTDRVQAVVKALQIGIV